MMKHKKLLALALGMILSLTACGTSPAAVPPAENSTAATEQTVTYPVTDHETSSTVPFKEEMSSEEAVTSEETASPEQVKEESSSEETQAETSDDSSSDVKETEVMKTSEEIVEKTLHLYINENEIAVTWENNESVEALIGLVEENPVTVQMSMYGGFEQVGSLGSRLPSNDVQTTTSAGDIVLYSSSQIVIFYGSNSWAYTRLGKAADQTAAQMADLLGNGNVTVTISYE